MSTSGASSLLVTPGKAFCSWMAVLMPFLAAQRTTGPETYPPQPMTRSGCTSFIMARAFGPERARFQRVMMFRLMLFRESLRWKPVISMWWKG